MLPLVLDQNHLFCLYLLFHQKYNPFWFYLHINSLYKGIISRSIWWKSKMAWAELSNFSEFRYLLQSKLKEKPKFARVGGFCSCHHHDHPDSFSVKHFLFKFVLTCFRTRWTVRHFKMNCLEDWAVSSFEDACAEEQGIEHKDSADSSNMDYEFCFSTITSFKCSG